MVLTELGAKLSSALRKLGESPVVDEEVLAELLKEVAAALLQADVRVQLVKQFRDNIKAKVNIAELPAGTNRQNLIKTTVFEELVSMVNPGRKPYAVKRRKPNVVMFVGLQGAGKTTTVAKYALHYQRLKFKTCMVCADTFRAGAFEQLKVSSFHVCAYPRCLRVHVCDGYGVYRVRDDVCLCVTFRCAFSVL